MTNIYNSQSTYTNECGSKCLIVRFVISARQILKSETNEVGLIKKSYVEEENSLSSLNTNIGERKNCSFSIQISQGLVVRLIMACLLVDEGGDWCIMENQVK